ncbi:hypothetical protein DGG96_11055 [Legionella qingyii]|uniref:Uncharacterized protein n=1 Tax=Legionella qingyii TaxID=2184757 RepID=A0A317U332_9GAMM|nr:hypothetical protein [Legionella qingyii]PWY55635.1 hypothetical protein DGG96_11055 [Legionella qingyii]RUR21770.1 hypothetical protein ELY20_11115 [Legionella qingyii]RUR25302.1 hypothetical protein ELY16_10235 [Legionella qingyii]
MGRKEEHEKIARFLQEKIQEKIGNKFSFTCSADADGIYFRLLTPQGFRPIGERREIEDMFRDIGIAVTPKISTGGTNNEEINHTLAGNPSEIEQLLRQLDSKMAEDYRLLIETENGKIIDNLNRLTAKDGIKWNSSQDGGVVCQHEQTIPRVPRSNSLPADSAADYFLFNLKARGINAQPNMELLRRNPTSVMLESSFKPSQFEQIKGELKIAFENKLDAKNPLNICSDYANKCQNEDPDACRERLFNEFFNTIVALSTQYPNMDGLQEMRRIIRNSQPYENGPCNEPHENILKKVIQEAKWKKSDSEFMKNFHQLRGRSEGAENFYQKLAALDSNNTQAIKEFNKNMGDILSSKSEETRGYGCW